MDSFPSSNSYSLPPMIGPKIPNKPASKDYIMNSRRNIGSFDQDLAKTPGPARLVYSAKLSLTFGSGTMLWTKIYTRNTCQSIQCWSDVSFPATRHESPALVHTIQSMLASTRNPFQSTQWESNTLSISHPWWTNKYNLSYSLSRFIQQWK